MKDITLKINNVSVTVPEGTTILQAAKKVQIKIPTLCYHPDLPPSASCGICIVKNGKSPKLLRACCTPVADNMDIITHDPEVVQVRKTVLELILSNHPNDCLKCGKNGNCELQDLAAEFGIRETSFASKLRDLPKDVSTPSIELHPQKCILCGRCVEVCQQMQNVWALEFMGRGFEMRIAPAADALLGDSPCVKCGQCSAHCPVGAIFEKDNTSEVWDALRDEKLHTAVQIAPATRVALGEAFGFESGTLTTGKMYALLRRLGFDAVFDTNFSADVTIMEEASEFVERFTKQTAPLPLITTCCPSWVDYMEKYYPCMLPHFSSAKSPQQMLGALAKTYYAEEKEIDPAKIYMVSIMPCTSKKYEVARNSDMSSSGYQDVDLALTTRELARMAKLAGIDFTNLPEEDADSLLGSYSGAGTIFGATGGVMEAALRSAYTFVTGEKLGDINFTMVRGLEGVKEATINIKGIDVKIAVAHELKNIQSVMNRVKAAIEKGEELPYHFIEVMACRGGCIGGGGQPYGATDEVRKKRAAGLYLDDEQQEIRLSHENPQVIALYDKFLEKPLSHKAHKLLHTKYHPKPLYNR